jgi:hypothetical protein
VHAAGSEIELVFLHTQCPEPVMAGLVPAIHVLACGEDVDARPAQTSLRSLRKLDCVAGHDGE